MTIESQKLLRWCLYAAVAMSSIATALKAISRISLPYELNAVEGRMLFTGLHLANGGALYPPLTGPPYVINAYPPLLYYVLSFLVKVGGITFAYPRAIVFLSALLVCVMLSLLLYRWTHSLGVSLTFGFIYLTIPIVQPWLYVIRLDFLALPFTFLGLYLFVLFPRRWFLAVPPFAIAIMLQYTLVAAPGACFVYMALKRQWKPAVLFAASLAAILSCAVVWEQYRTGGWFGFYMLQGRNSPYSIEQIVGMVLPLVRTHAFFLVLAAFVFCVDRSRRIVSLPVIYLVLASVTSLTAGKSGAQENHLLQVIAVACVCAGISYDWLQNNVAVQQYRGLVIVALTLLVLANTTFRFSRPVEELAECDRAYAFVKDHGGRRILSEDVGALVVNGKSVSVSDPFVYRWLVAGGKLSPSDLEGLVRSRAFDSIVFSQSTDIPWPESVREAIHENYKLTRCFVCADARYIYQPLIGPAPHSGGGRPLNYSSR